MDQAPTGRFPTRSRMLNGLSDSFVDDGQILENPLLDKTEIEDTSSKKTRWLKTLIKPIESPRVTMNVVSDT